jgi:acyl transferase domain-containing protein
VWDGDAANRALEAHGTGTALGDPIEVFSLESIAATENVFQVGAANRALSAKSEVVHCTSLKSNTGHLEPAAAAAALATVVVMPLSIVVVVVNAQLRLLVHKKQALLNGRTY